ncbi:hypothetical protein N7462_003368 [Penicillium macrosclerotiorum]|uniref:uncharacterized protein n=1 Tax=Penicillium macrosclerotiorum TaxID=303699 RepID=UPI002547E1E7|nr:uncharacterized protein N7462_003368 [Penicillium macrosclerotiorum]KAJ5688976.1 hypothetical protein N7462_003368 [Penicillium macrosclerotiorum]
MEDLNLYILTANCARNLIDVDLFADHFFDVLSTSSEQQLDAPELIVLSLQELAPIAYSFLGGSYLLPYFDAFTNTVKKATAKQWNESYVNLVKDHTGMTGLMVFARADVTDKIAWVDTAHVGFGMQEMGNKGAVGARLGYVVDERPSKTVDLTFVAAHLAPMENALAQRNLDWQSIVERLVFSHGDAALPKALERQSSTPDESTALLRDHEATHHTAGSQTALFASHSYVFLAGDLNYRTSNIGPLKGDAARFPQRDAPRTSSAHYCHLLQDDQLRREMQHGRVFHGLSEAPIDFPPTYKYSSAAQAAARVALTNPDAAPVEWKWSSHRWPSWCDRILYLDPAAPADGAGSGKVTIKPRVYDALPLFPHSDHRPVALAVSVPLTPGNASGSHLMTNASVAAPFAIDPSWQSRRDAARRKEIIVGALAFLGLTWEGNGMLLASVLGLVGAWVVLRSMWT